MQRRSHSKRLEEGSQRAGEIKRRRGRDGSQQDENSQKIELEGSPEDQESIRADVPAPAAPGADSREKEQETKDCGICFEKIDVQGELDNCAHPFCFDCIYKWSQRANTWIDPWIGPLCKQRFGNITKVDLNAPRAPEPRRRGGRGGRGRGRSRVRVQQRNPTFSDSEDEFRGRGFHFIPSMLSLFLGLGGPAGPAFFLDAPPMPPPPVHYPFVVHPPQLHRRHHLPQHRQPQPGPPAVITISDDEDHSPSTAPPPAASARNIASVFDLTNSSQEPPSIYSWEEDYLPIRPRSRERTVIDLTLDDDDEDGELPPSHPSNGIPALPVSVTLDEGSEARSRG